MKKLWYYDIQGLTFGIAVKDDKITDIFIGKKTLPYSSEEKNYISDMTAKCLREYFRGERINFDIPIFPEGTEFQKKVWEITSRIPYGESMTYGDIAQSLGNKNLARAVGNALNKNPMLILIPCHRVVGASENKFGFAIGEDMKKMLMNIEGIYFD